MKRSVLAGMMLISTLFGQAAAADLPPRYYQQPKPPLVYSPLPVWTGFYLGINGGGGWGRSHWDGFDRFDVSGGLVGGTIGYNIQAGQAVFGLEGDIDWSGIGGTANPALCPFALSCTTNNDWLSTVRLRLGYAFGQVMPYLTGGLAVGNIRAEIAPFTGIDQVKAGWTVGGGVEYAFAPRWSAKLEYLYVDLGTVNCGLNCALLATGDVSFRTNLLRAGINYRF